MPYAYTTASGRIYYLHRKAVTLSNGRPMTVYYFAGRSKPGETLEAVPAGYTVVEPSRAARPSLRKQARA
jgi:hypothetical protein